HACIGAPLIVEGQIEGLLTIDALDPGALDDVDDLVLAGIATIAAAGVRTTRLIDALAAQASESQQLVRQLARDGDNRTGHILCQSFAMREVCGEVALAAQSDLTVLVTGETGTGKEVVA